MWAGPWEAEAVGYALATATLRTLLPLSAGGRSRIGECTGQDPRGRHHPVGHPTRPRARGPRGGGGTGGRAAQPPDRGPKNLRRPVPLLPEGPIGAMGKRGAGRGGPPPGPPERGAPGPGAGDEGPSTGGGGGTRGRA